MKPYVRTIICVAASCLLIQAAGAQQPDANEAHEFKGKLVAAREAEVAPRLDAVLSKIDFTTGQMVKEGDLLFEFESKSKELALAEAQAKQKVIEAKLSFRDVQLKNTQTLRTRNVSSEMQLLEAQGRRDIEAANAEEAAANVQLAELAVKQMKLIAPISGLISRPFVREGAYITVGSVGAQDQRRLATIDQLDPIQVVGEVPFDTYLQQRKTFGSREKGRENIEFTLILPNGEEYPHKGRIVAGTSEFDPTTQLMPIAVEFPNPDYLLRPGLEVTLRSSVRE